jgi:hypothetical protein
MSALAKSLVHVHLKELFKKKKSISRTWRVSARERKTTVHIPEPVQLEHLQKYLKNKLLKFWFLTLAKNYWDTVGAEIFSFVAKKRFWILF